MSARPKASLQLWNFQRVSNFQFSRNCGVLQMWVCYFWRNLRTGFQNHLKMMFISNTSQPHFLFIIQFRKCMMHQPHTEMALHVKLCTKHNYQFMRNLDLEIFTQKLLVMFSISLQNGHLPQEGYCSRTVLSTLVEKKDMVLSLMAL